MGIRVRKSDEMETIVSGVLFAINNIPDECYTWVPPGEADTDAGVVGAGRGAGGGKRGSIRAASARIAKVSDKDLLYKTIAVAKHHKPWLVVNVGSGVSMLKLDEQVRLGCRV